jgi:polyisoprenoid-binding protein YceI
MKKFFLIILYLIISEPVFPASIYNIANIQAKKDGTTIEYTLVHPLHTVHGINKDVDCNIKYDEATDKVIAVSVRADVLSFDSGNSNRDSHMGEVVDALEYPEVIFNCDSVKYLNNDTLSVVGQLTFHNVTKTIPVKVSEKFDNHDTIFNGDFYISLTEFKIKRPSLLLMPVEDKLTLQFNIVVPKVLKKT